MQTIQITYVLPDHTSPQFAEKMKEEFVCAIEGCVVSHDWPEDYVICAVVKPLTHSVANGEEGVICNPIAIIGRTDGKSFTNIAGEKVTQAFCESESIASLYLSKLSDTEGVQRGEYYIDWPCSPRKMWVQIAKSVIKQRLEDAKELHLSDDFINGFEEGIAEFIALFLLESATDVLEDVTTDV